MLEVKVSVNAERSLAFHVSSFNANDQERGAATALLSLSKERAPECPCFDLRYPPSPQDEVMKAKEKSDNRGRHWKDKVLQGCPPEPWKHTKDWAERRTAKENEFSDLLRNRGMVYTLPWRRPNSALRSMGNTNKVLFIELLIHHLNGVAVLTFVEEVTCFLGIQSVKVSAENRKIFDAGLIPSVSGKRGVESGAHIKTLIKIWHTAGFVEQVLEGGALSYVFDQETCGRMRAQAQRADEKRRRTAKPSASIATEARVSLDALKKQGPESALECQVVPVSASRTSSRPVCAQLRAVKAVDLPPLAAVLRGNTRPTAAGRMSQPRTVAATACPASSRAALVTTPPCSRLPAAMAALLSATTDAGNMELRGGAAAVAAARSCGVKRERPSSPQSAERFVHVDGAEAHVSALPPNGALGGPQSGGRGGGGAWSRRDGAGGTELEDSAAKACTDGGGRLQRGAPRGEGDEGKDREQVEVLP